MVRTIAILLVAWVLSGIPRVGEGYTLFCGSANRDLNHNNTRIKSTMEEIRKNTPQLKDSQGNPLTIGPMSRGLTPTIDFVGCNKLESQFKKLLTAPGVMRDCYPDDPSMATEAEDAIKSVGDFKEFWCPQPSLP